MLERDKAQFIKGLTTNGKEEDRELAKSLVEQEILLPPEHRHYSNALKRYPDVEPYSKEQINYLLYSIHKGWGTIPEKELQRVFGKFPDNEEEAND
jgi:hypothetical protein